MGSKKIPQIRVLWKGEYGNLCLFTWSMLSTIGFWALKQFLCRINLFFDTSENQGGFDFLYTKKRFMGKIYKEWQPFNLFHHGHSTILLVQ